MWGMNHSYVSCVSHDSSTCVDTTHLSVWHILSLTSRAGMCDMTLSTVCAMWLIHTCNTTHSNACHDTFEWVACYASCETCDSFIRATGLTWQIRMSDMWCFISLAAMCHVTRPYMSLDSITQTTHCNTLQHTATRVDESCDSSIYVIGLNHTCHKSHSHMSHLCPSTPLWVCVTWLLHTYQGTHLNMWQNSFQSVTGLISIFVTPCPSSPLRDCF